MVNFEENYHFSRLQRGSNIFPIETHITCDFPGGGGVQTPWSPPPPPLDSHLDAYKKSCFFFQKRAYMMISEIVMLSCQCLLLIAFTNSLIPDHAQPYVSLDLNPNCLKLLLFLIRIFSKK